MRKYSNKNHDKLEKVLCNQCGKELEVVDGILREGEFRGEIQWGYFSHKDGEIHTFDLCEDCYDKWISQFAIKIKRENKNEFL